LTVITFTLTTKIFGPVVRKTITSLAQNIQRFNHSCNLLIIDKSKNAETLEWLNTKSNLLDIFTKVLQLNSQEIQEIEQQNSIYIRNAQVDLEQDSIQRSRVQLILAISHFRSEINGSIIWQLDDDMVFDYVENERPFPDIIGKVISFHLNNPEVDAATGTGFHTPPLPVLLYLEKNLKDLIAGKPLPKTGLSTSPSYYHDLYSDFDFTQKGPKVERTQTEFENLLQQILSGKPVFRPIPDAFFEPEKPWHRGGNFILFNLEAALALPHLAVHYKGLTSRRSDMIHARLLHEAGFVISGIPMSLYHFRDQSLLPDFTKLKLEYLRDALGAASVRFIDEEEAALKRLSQHKAHIDRLIGLVQPLVQNTGSTLTYELLKTLEEVRNELNSWHEDELTASFLHLKNNYYLFLTRFKDEKNSRTHWAK
jgi:hypothetical protein